MTWKNHAYVCLRNIYVLFNVAISFVQIMHRLTVGWLVSNEMEGMWREAAVT
jgi:hypothetical protein